MKVTLKQLNDGYQALRRLAERDMPKDQFKLTYKIGRIYKSAKAEIESLVEAQEKMMKAHGFSKYDSSESVQNDPDRGKKIEAFNRESLKMMKDTVVDLWGDPFKPAEILGVVPINGEDFGDLYEWLIVGELTDEQIEKVAAASA